MSRQFLRNAEYSIHQLIKKSNDLSYKSRYDYEKDLKMMVGQLHGMGIQISDIKHLKPKHVDKLVDEWKEKVSSRTIKNRLCRVRYVARKINKRQLLEKSNDEYGLAKVVCSPVKNRAIHEIDITKIRDPYVRLSVELQQQFGLRREESIKFVPSLADNGEYIELKGPWTKGGIGRLISVTTAEQKSLLNKLKEAVGKNCSLIPRGTNYRQQENVYVAEVRAANYKNLHGLRHAYAQNRYRVLVDELSEGKGWESPINGGPKQKDLEAWQREIDSEARRLISHELGHTREEISKTYLG
jgi:hypothetical protein